VTIGDEALFVNVGERTNVTGSKAFRPADPQRPVRGGGPVARQQVENGAQVIDVNMDEAMLGLGRGDDALPQPGSAPSRTSPACR